MRTRVATVLAGVLLLVVSGCGGSPSVSPPGSDSGEPSPSASLSPSRSPSVAGLTPTVTINGGFAVGVPSGWLVERSEVQDGSGRVCLAPKGDTKVVFDCAGVAIYFGKRLPGAETGAYAPDVDNGWYPATDVENCPFTSQAPGAKFVGVTTRTGFSRGLKPVGAHRADWNRWTASCAGRTFHPQAWYLPKSRVVIFDYLDHPETASLLASTVFAADGTALPAAPTYVSAHVVSGTSSQLVVQPFRTYTTGPAGKAYAAAHGLEYPFPNDYYDADLGPTRTITLDASTLCVGGTILGHDISNAPVPCADFGSHPKLKIPAGIWLQPDGSTAESVTEIFRP